MYRKTLILAAVVFATLGLTAMTYHGDPQAWKAARQSKNYSAGVHASGPKPTTFAASNPPSFSKVDINGNSLISSREALAIGIPFGTLDLNGDRMITRSEYNIATAKYYRRSAIGLHDKAG